MSARALVAGRVTLVTRVTRGAAAAAAAVLLTAHVGSPDVFFRGRAGPYDVRVVVRPPEVVPGIARVTVRTGADVQRVAIRPVFWRVGSRGSPSADETRRLEGEHGTFSGSLWLMARGAYSVDVIVEGARGRANVMVPVASVATGRLAMGPMLGALLAVLGLVLFAGLVTIVYKGAGESLLGASDVFEAATRRRARRVAAIAVPVLGAAVFGGWRWWEAVDRDYARNLYRPSPLALQLAGDVLRLEATDTLWQPPGRPSAIVPDHGKLMHLFLVRAGDASAFAHLHPVPVDSSAQPAMLVKIPPVPAGRYHVYGDVVHETGFERTLVGTLALPDVAARAVAPAQTVHPDPEDAWHAGDAIPGRGTVLADGSVMRLELEPSGAVTAQRELTIRISVAAPDSSPARLEPYLGMPAHAVVTRVDGAVYVHLHPMGTVTMAAQDAFLARDRGDTTDAGRLRLAAHAAHPPALPPAAAVSSAEFPYAFPAAGSYRLFVQVRRAGRILTGAFAITVAEAVELR